MALEFDNPDGHTYFSKVAHPSGSSAGAVVTATPLTMFCRFNPSLFPSLYSAMIAIMRDPPGFGSYEYFQLRMQSVDRGQRVEAAAAQLSGLVFVGSSAASTYSLGTWQSAAAVFTSSTSRTAYYNGVAGTADTASCVPAILENTYIGAATLVSIDNFGSAYNGCLADCAIWDVALTQQNITDLNAGALPSTIQPSHLVWYLPFVGFSTANDAYKWDGAAVTQTTDAVLGAGAGAIATCASSPSGAANIGAYTRIIGL